MACLPWEMTAEILCRLPVKDLLRYRCVAKPWRSLIDCHDFIKKHLNHSLQTNSNHGLILTSRDQHGVRWVDLDTLDRAAVKIPYPVKNTRTWATRVEVIGSCNGLLALQISENDVAVVLFNPSTRRFRNVEPPPSLACKPLPSFTYGFGHDHVHDDYKLVRVSPSNSSLNMGILGHEVYVYSAKSNSWRKTSHVFHHFVRHFDHNYHGILSNNNLHWLVFRKSTKVDLLIVSFHIVTEEYHEVPLPASVNDSFEGSLSLFLDEIGGSLCMINFNYKEDPTANQVDVWMMKEYGVEESWTKFVVKLSIATSIFNFVFPIAYLKKDTILFNQNSGKLISYDLERRVTSDVSIFGAPLGDFEAKLCVGSLVRLDNDGDDRMLSWKQVEEDKEGKTICRIRQWMISCILKNENSCSSGWI